MRDRAGVRPSRVRTGIVLACAVCTVWLVVQNAILFTFVSWDRLPSIHSLPQAAGVMFGGFIVLTLAAAAFALGWLASRHGHASRHGEHSHD